MKRLRILLVIAAAGTVAACAPTEDASPSNGAPDDSAMPTLAPSTDPLTESPAMSVEPTTAP